MTWIEFAIPLLFLAVALGGIALGEWKARKILTEQEEVSDSQ